MSDPKALCSELNKFAKQYPCLTAMLCRSYVPEVQHGRAGVSLPALLNEALPFGSLLVHSIDAAGQVRFELRFELHAEPLLQVGET